MDLVLIELLRNAMQARVAWQRVGLRCQSQAQVLALKCARSQDELCVIAIQEGL